MKRIKIIHIGLLCGLLCFLAGMVFTATEYQFALLIGGGFLLLGIPLCMQIQKTQSLQAKAGMQKTPGIAEYGAILAFVAVLVYVVFQITDNALKGAISAHMSGPSF